MHFSIVKINPEDASPSHGFDDAILPLYHALRGLGYETEILFNRVNPSSRNIVFGSCISPRRTGRILPKGSVVFNLEQINRESKWCNDNYLTHLRDFTVWDYSPENVREMRGLGIMDVQHVPLGYVPEMTRLNPDFPPDVDMLFYGLVTQRRHEMILRLLSSGVKTLASQEAFGNLRDKLLAHCRAVLNLHQFSPARLEVVRLGYVWANKKAVLSERGADTEIPDYLAEACLYAGYDEIPEAAQRLLKEDKLLEKQSVAGFRAFSSRPMSLGLEKLLGRRNFPVSAPRAYGGRGPCDGRAVAQTKTQPYYNGPQPEWLISPSQ